MKRSNNYLKLAAIAAMMLLSVTLAHAQIVPTPIAPPDRDLRDDYVRSWYLYNDADSNGILAPGDEKLTGFANWWTNDGSENSYMTFDPGTPAYEMDIPAVPNSASNATAVDNYWLNTGHMAENRMTFYMGYSQWENNTDVFYDGATGAYGQVLGDYYTERYNGVNGFHLGWVTNNYNPANPATPAGNVEMDVMVHNGRFEGISPESYGTSDSDVMRSNPQVMMGDVDAIRTIRNYMVDPNNGMHRTLSYNEATQSYDDAANDDLVAWFADRGKTITSADIAAVAATMEIQERDAFGAWLAANAVDTNLTPQDVFIATGYVYQDAFSDRSEYYANSTDGGVISGLAGITEGVAENWANQMVIRIDLSDATLDDIDEIVFLDFLNTGSGQVNPVEIVLNVENGQIYQELDGTPGLSAGDFVFDDNRIFIGQNADVPEPGTMIMLGLGGMGFLAKRKRNKKAAA